MFSLSCCPPARTWKWKQIKGHVALVAAASSTSSSSHHTTPAPALSHPRTQAQASNMARMTAPLGQVLRRYVWVVVLAVLGSRARRAGRATILSYTATSLSLFFRVIKTRHLSSVWTALLLDMYSSIHSPLRPCSPSLPSTPQQNTQSHRCPGPLRFCQPPLPHPRR